MNSVNSLITSHRLIQAVEVDLLLMTDECKSDNDAPTVSKADSHSLLWLGRRVPLTHTIKWLIFALLETLNAIASVELTLYTLSFLSALI